MSISTGSTFTPPVPSTRASAVILSVDRSVPQRRGTTITWTATPRGGRGPYQYKWLLHNGSEWDVVKNWSPSNSLRWTPAFANPKYRVAVWVRGADGPDDDFEATTEAAFAIDELPFASAAAAMPEESSAAAEPVSIVTLVSNPAPPQPAGTTVLWTAAATGGGAQREFKWFVYDGHWNTAAPWSTRDTFEWTPLTPNPRCRIAVWARSAGSTSDYFEACAEIEFPIIDDPSSSA